MELLEQFFRTNQIVILFGNGLVFFLMGFSVYLESRRPSQLRLARHLPLLGLFGMINGAATWGQVFIPIQRSYLPEAIVGGLEALMAILLALSFAFLFTFGAGLLAETRPRLTFLPWVGWLAFAAWFVGFVWSGLREGTPGIRSWLLLSDIWSRYLLGFTGSVLAAWGLAEQRAQFDEMGLGHLDLNLGLGVVAFLVFALSGGLVVPAAGFFPASRLNEAAFFAWFRIPVDALRALAGLGIAYATIRLLELYDVEAALQHETHQRMVAVLNERDRIARELHDGVIQQLYGVGLHLESALYLIDKNPEEARRQIRQNMGRLDNAIKDIRRYITGLRTPGEEESAPLPARLRKVAEEFRRTYPVEVRVQVRRVSRTNLSPEAVEHVVQIVRESMTNAVRHGHPRQITVRLEGTPQGLEVAIEDDGVGFDPSAVAQRETGTGQGLKNMRERAGLIGGRLEIWSHPGAGTRVRLMLDGGDEARGDHSHPDR
ncbi:MAG TPA: sensor histidine kinase [Limnochorda sp.]